MPETTAQTASEIVFKVEDADVALKRVHVQVPRALLVQERVRVLDELCQEMVLPGFRKGKAPRSLIEKRMGDSLKGEVARAVLEKVADQMPKDVQEKAVDEPELQDPKQGEMPDEGDWTLAFDIVVEPDFTYPELKGVALKRPQVKIEDKHVQQAMENLATQQGKVEKVAEGAQAGDMIVADVDIREGGVLQHAQKNVYLAVAEGPVLGLKIDGISAALTGVKADEKKVLSTVAPADHDLASIRGKSVEVDVTVRSVLRRKPAVLDQAFLDSLGFKDIEELKVALREELEHRLVDDTRDELRIQMTRYLVEKTSMPLPKKLTAKQTSRIVQRRATNLLKRGASATSVQQNLARVSEGAELVAEQELKLEFILRRLAEERKIQPSREELHQEITDLAIRAGKRPEKLLAELEKSGQISSVYTRLVHNKVLDSLVTDATVEEMEMDAYRKYIEETFKSAQAAEAPKA